MVKKHEGIVVVAYKPGQPRSEVVAALELADLGDEFTTDVAFKGSGEAGVAAKVDLYYEAEALVYELEWAGINGCICQGEHGWEVA